jgi:nicotinamide-nucleotide amidase
MHAEIIAAGTELTTGAKLDTNSQWLSLELSAVGIPVAYHVTVADDLDANVDVLRAAVERSDVVLISGGLGPTLDDLTRDALARLTRTQLVLHQPSLDVIRAMFARRKRDMPPRNIVQAMFPERSEPIPNRRGTAPGIYLEVPRAGKPACRIAAMPGVPNEMKAMFEEEVLPRIRPAEAAGLVIRHARINCFGLGESAAEELLGDVTARGRDPEVGITVHEATITLRIVATAPSEARALEMIDTTKKVIYERMGEYAFGEGDDELEHVVVRLLRERNQTLATAELATGGLLAHRLTSVAGNDACYRGGLIVAHDMSTRGLSAGGTSSRQGDDAMNADTARTRAEDCRRQFDTDCALCVGSVSHNEDREEKRAAPVVWIALAERAEARAVELNVAGDPAIVKSRVAKSALNLLRLKLLT